jgi:hypothetical protein
MVLDDLLETGLLASVRRKEGGALLTGLGARLTRASELARPAAVPAAPAARAVLDPSAGVFERLLGTLPKGKLVELVGRRSSGRHSLALAALASATSSGESAAFVDLGDTLDPQAAEAAGVDLERVLWVRPPRIKTALSAAEMLLATGFPLVVADLGVSPRGSRYLPDASWVRLARAAQAASACLLVVTPWRMSGIAAEAVVTSDVARPIWIGEGKFPRLLEGIASHAHLEKWGRQTPGTTAPMALRAPGSIPRSPDRLTDHPITRSPDHPILTSNRRPSSA